MMLLKSYGRVGSNFFSLVTAQFQWLKAVVHGFCVNSFLNRIISSSMTYLLAKSLLMQMIVFLEMAIGTTMKPQMSGKASTMLQADTFIPLVMQWISINSKILIKLTAPLLRSTKGGHHSIVLL